MSILAVLSTISSEEEGLSKHVGGGKGTIWTFMCVTPSAAEAADTQAARKRICPARAMYPSAGH